MGFLIRTGNCQGARLRDVARFASGKGSSQSRDHSLSALQYKWIAHTISVRRYCFKEERENPRETLPLSQDTSQGSRIEFRMIRDNDLSKGRVAAKDDVVAVLPLNLKIDFEKSRNASPP
jgi:hypothetical protein